MITQAIIIFIAITFGWFLRDLRAKKIVKQIKTEAQRVRLGIRKKVKPHRGVMMEWQKPEEPEKEAEREARRGLNG